MNKLLLALTIAGAGLGGCMISLKDEKAVYGDRLKENENIAKQIDWRDSQHLRLCPESDLEKRVLPYKSAVNMRDIGGYQTDDKREIKWHKIYRGEELGHLSREDFEKFSELGITHVIDLRDIKEAKKHRVPKGAAYTNIPVLEDLRESCFAYDYPNFVDQFMRNIYSKLITLRGDMFCKVLKILRDDPDAVLYIHCTNGKDRTGIMIALIMLLAGVDKEQVISEFSLSNLEVNRAFEIFDGELVKEFGQKSGDLLYGTIGVDPNWLDLVLDYIDDNFSSIEDFLLVVSDLTKEDLAVIKENITQK